MEAQEAEPQPGTGRRWGVGAAVVGSCLAIYLLTASWGFPLNVDVVTNVVTAERLAATGSPVLPADWSATAASPFYGEVAWILDTPRGPISKYPIGAPLAGAVGYLLAGEAPPGTVELVSEAGNAVAVPFPEIWPATAMAALLTVIGVGLVYGGLVGRVGVGGAAAWAMVVGLGTSAWAVASDALWQHSVTIPLLAGAVGALGARRPWLAGLLFGLAIVVRPVTGVIPAVVVAWAMLHPDRRTTGLPLVPGLGLGGFTVMAYNRWAFGSWSPLGGYSTELSDRLGGLDGPIGWLAWFATNLGQSLVGIRVGVLLWSPFLVLAVVGVAGAWRRLEWWSRPVLVGAVAYLLVQAATEVGDPDFWPYRYPLEAIFASALVLGVGSSAWWRRNLPAKAAMVLLVGLAVVAQAVVS